MKALIIGGAGVFGAKVAELLLRDGVDVTIAGRDTARTQRAASALNCAAMILDRRADLGPILSLRPDIVIDAAGPFQNYGAEGYALARFCIDHSVHYFDLSDDAAFAAGIVALDDAARAKGVVVLSGASSVPAISAAAVRVLSGDMQTIELVDTAILPGNRAPRGKSVIAAILGQVGAPLKLYRDGWTHARAWSEPRRYTLSNGDRRSARLIGAPDLELFPAAFKAKSVTFRAGMELGVLNACVGATALLRRMSGFKPSGAFIDIALAVANLFAPFGTDRGGMIVAVTGVEGGAPMMRTWRLFAEAGEGPFVPAAPIRALVRKLASLSPGARPCIADLSLDDIKAALTDLAITTDMSAETAPPLFAQALGAAWSKLPNEIRAAHEVWDQARFTGRASVERGASIAAKLAAFFFGFPKAGADVPVTVAMRRTEKGETWTRRFAGRAFRSHLSFDPKSGLTERFGPFAFGIALSADENQLAFPVAHGRAFGIPLPRWALPVSEARETVADGQFGFDVALHAPLGFGLIVRYRGTLARARD